MAKKNKKETIVKDIEITLVSKNKDGTTVKYSTCPVKLMNLLEKTSSSNSKHSLFKRIFMFNKVKKLIELEKVKSMSLSLCVLYSLTQNNDNLLDEILNKK